MTNNCYYCRAIITKYDSLPIITGAKTEYICVACDDRVQAYTRDAEMD